MRTHRARSSAEYVCPGMDESYYPGPRSSPSFAEIAAQFNKGMYLLSRQYGRSAEQIADALTALRQAGDYQWPGPEPSRIEKDEIQDFITPRERALSAKLARSAGPVDKYGLDGRRRR